MKKVSFILAIFFLFLGQSVSFAKDNESEEIAVKFVKTTMSDFANKKDYREELISPRAKLLRQYLRDRRLVMERQQEVLGRNHVEKKAVVNSVESKSLGKDQEEVLIDMGFTFLDGGAESYMSSSYRVVVDTVEDKVLAAVSDDLSGGVMGTEIKSLKDFKIEDQVNNKSLHYNIEEVLASIKVHPEAYVDELEKVTDNYAVEMKINGVPIYSDKNSLLCWDRTFVPARTISEILGVQVAWDGEDRSVTLEKGEKNILLTIDTNQAIVNGEKEQVDSRKHVAPFIKDNSAYVPLRFLAETLGFKVEYVQKNGKNLISMSKNGLQPIAWAIESSQEKEASSIKLERGDVVKVLEVKGDLAKIKALFPMEPVGEENLGWISLESIQTGVPMSLREKESKVIHIVKDKTKVYEEPWGEEAGEVNQGYTLVLEKKNKWYKVAQPGGARDVWVKREDVDFDYEEYFYNK